jgi:hypothetical protein
MPAGAMTHEQPAVMIDDGCGGSIGTSSAQPRWASWFGSALGLYDLVIISLLANAWSRSGAFELIM